MTERTVPRESTFALITDEHFPTAVIEALQGAGWSVVRVVDVLGQSTDDDVVLDYGVQHGRVFVSSDERAQAMVIARLQSGRPTAGFLVWAQRHRKSIGPGEFVRLISELAAEDDPFACGIRHIKPEP